jgi:hypothetical protein
MVHASICLSQGPSVFMTPRHSARLFPPVLASASDLPVLSLPSCHPLLFYRYECFPIFQRLVSSLWLLVILGFLLRAAMQRRVGP